MPLTAPRLWVAATPLGNPDDLSPRAREVLSSVSLVLAEDTRRALRLFQACGIEAHRVASFHEHNEKKRQEGVLRLLRQGHAVALVCDAGTPLMADPGFRLVQACRAEGIKVSPLPGPSAPVAALSAAGIAPLPYSFLGFLPRDAAGRKALFSAFASVPGSLVFFERKNRLKSSLKQAAALLGPRDVAICRELTKTHEDFILLRLENSADIPDDLRGEITVVIGPPEEEARASASEVERLLHRELAQGGKPRQVVRRVQSAVRGWTGKEVYALLSATNNSHGS